MGGFPTTAHPLSRPSDLGFDHPNMRYLGSTKSTRIFGRGCWTIQTCVDHPVIDDERSAFRSPDPHFERIYTHPLPTSSLASSSSYTPAPLPSSSPQSMSSHRSLDSASDRGSHPLLYQTYPNVQTISRPLHSNGNLSPFPTLKLSCVPVDLAGS